MNTVKANSQFGNFEWFGHAEVTDEQYATLASLGFLWVMQRSPSSNAEKSLAGYKKRPDGFKRSNIQYTAESAVELVKLLSAKAEIADGMEITPVIDNVKEYEPTVATPKYAEERAIIARHVQKKDIDEWITTVGYSGDTVDHEGNPTTEFLQAVKVYKNKLIAAA